MASTALTRPKPPLASQVPGGLCRSSGIAPSRSSPARICAGVSVRDLLEHQGRHGRGVGRRRRGAEEARAGSATGWSAVAGSPGNGGLLVSMIQPGEKNDVLPPSGAVTAGFSTSRPGVASAMPSGLKTLEPGPDELNGSLASGFCPGTGPAPTTGSRRRRSCWPPSRARPRSDRTCRRHCRTAG